MKRLLAVNNYYYQRGGSEKVFFGHNRLLKEAGWTVAPFSMQHPDNHPSSWSGYFIENSDTEGVVSLSRKITMAGRVIYSLEARRNLRHMLKEFSPDICHLHNIYHHISPSILSLVRGRGIPLVMTLHDLKLACPAYSMMSGGEVCERCKGGRLYNLLRHRCIKNSLSFSSIVLAERLLHDLLGSYRKFVDRFVVPSKFLLEKLVEWGWERDRFTLIPNFIDTDGISPNFEPGKRFLYFGRLSHEKGVAVLIKAAARAGAALTIVGTGPEQRSLQELAGKLDGDVKFLGYLGGQALREAVGAARMVVLPSICYENAPMALMEAYALGKPVLASDIGGIPELVREDTGATFPSGSAEELADLLAHYSEQPDTALKQMGRDGRQWMSDEFSPEHYRRRVLGLYGELGVRV